MIKRLKRKYIAIVMVAVTLVLGIIITAINITSYTSLNSQLYEKLMLIVENEGKMPDFPLPEYPDVEDNEDESDNDSSDESEESKSDEEKDEGEEPEEDVKNEENDESVKDEESEENQESEEDKKSEEDKESEEDQEDEKEGKEDEKEENKKEEEKEDVRQHMSPETPFETRYFTVKFNTDGTVTAVDTLKIIAVDDKMAEAYAKALYAEGKESGYLNSYKYAKGNTEAGDIIYVFLDATRELESVRSFLVSSLVISGLGILLIFILMLLLSDVVLKPIIESYEKQKRFITDAGHEMKTPLTVISANAEIIEMQGGESEWVSGIKSQVAKLASLTEKLVILSKMEEGVKIEMSEFLLSDAIFDTCSQYRSIAMSKGIALELDISDGVILNGNEVEIRRCISLLLDNAFRYANENGWVRVSLKKNPGNVEIRISNSTTGIEKGSLDRWFDRFYRTDLSRNSDTGGSGIGLSVVKAIVHAHGGSVRAYSEDGIKVEFIINM